MAEINDLATTAGNNTGRFPEGMKTRQFNDGARELEAMLGRYYRDTDGSNVSAGTSTAYTLTSYRSITALTAGLMVTWRAHVACGNSPQFDLNGIGDTPLTDSDDRPLAQGDISTGQIVVMLYNDSRASWECLGIKTTLPRYLVDNLPVETAVVPMLAYATNGRKSGETEGNGTGVPVFYDGSNWCAFDTSTTVAD